MFDMDRPLYVTRGIADTLPKEIETTIWRCLEVLKKERQQQMDYLQVFKLSIDGNTQVVTNSQEKSRQW